MGHGQDPEFDRWSRAADNPPETATEYPEQEIPGPYGYPAHWAGVGMTAVPPSAVRPIPPGAVRPGPPPGWIPAGYYPYVESVPEEPTPRSRFPTPSLPQRMAQITEPVAYLDPQRATGPDRPLSAGSGWEHPHDPDPDWASPPQAGPPDPDLDWASPRRSAIDDDWGNAPDERDWPPDLDRTGTADQPAKPGRTIEQSRPQPGRSVESPAAGNPDGDEPEPAARSRTSRTRKWIGGGIGVLLLLGISGFGGYWLHFAEKPAATTVSAGQRPGPGSARDLSSREVDPVPMTIREVFPDRDIAPRDGQPPYQMVKAFSTRDCLRVATGDLRDLLGEAGCSHAVHGTIRSPDGTHLMNAGILNLADVGQANRVYWEIKPLLEDQLGRFQPPPLGPEDTTTVPVTATRTGWHAQGHFLIFCVLVRADGTAIKESDEAVRRILSDLVETHLRGVVLQRAASPMPSGN